MLVYDALEEYLYEISEHAEETQFITRYRLEQFVAWLKGRNITELESVTSSVVREYVGWLKERPSGRKGKEKLSITTVHNYAALISAWLNWCVEEDLMERGVKVKKPKLEDKLVDVLTVEQVQDMLRATDGEYSEWLVVRSKAVLMTLIDTGIRSSELIGLTVDQVHLEPGNSYISVYGKGRKWRDIALGSKCASMLKRWLRVRNADPLVDKNQQHFFLNRYRNPMSRNGLNEMLYRLAERAGVEGRVSAHVWRHTYATMTLENGGEIYRLSRSMGHSKVAVTEGYVKAINQRNLMNVSVLDNMKGSGHGKLHRGVSKER